MPRPAVLLLPLYARGRLPRPLRHWLRTLLRDDDDLRDRYQRLRRREARRENRSAGLSSEQMSVVLQAILDTVAPEPRRLLRSPSMALAMSAVLAAALTATLFFGAGFEGHPPPTTSTRSALSSTAATAL